MKSQIPEETLKKWREEFYTLAMKDKIDLPDYEFAERYYLVAKTSSYERENRLAEICKKKGDAIKSMSDDIVIVRDKVSQITKRDQLIEQANPFIETIIPTTDEEYSQSIEWLKQVEELKEK